MFLEAVPRLIPLWASFPLFQDNSLCVERTPTENEYYDTRQYIATNEKQLGMFIVYFSEIIDTNDANVIMPDKTIVVSL